MVVYLLYEYELRCKSFWTIVDRSVQLNCVSSRSLAVTLIVLDWWYFAAYTRTAAHQSGTRAHRCTQLLCM